MSQRQQFTGRGAFIFAAIGSAVGLGNIWRFPYVAYQGGGGAFILPYLVALLTAGLPLLMLLYAIGHKYRASAPLSFRRMSKGSEFIGWWQVGIASVIGIYYAAIIAWAIRYVGFSVSKSWGDNTEAFFLNDFLQRSDPGLVTKWVAGIGVPLILVWIFTLIVMRAGMQKGIARLSQVFIPLLVIIFVIFVGQAMLQPGAADGLNALFAPNWDALSDAGVWVSAYGQIFFSLSIAFGIMITYAAHLKRKTNLTAAALVVGLANSGFELLAGIGVFSALGFMAQAQGVNVADVVSDGVGLAFIAFPEIISTMPGGPALGILFFVSLVLAGITSLISIIEVPLDALEDKFGMNRTVSVTVVGGLMATVSIVFFSMSNGLNLLDVADFFTNQFGIVFAALLLLVVLSWGLRQLDALAAHLNTVSSFKVGTTWKILLSVVTPAILVIMLAQQLWKTIQSGYGSYPGWFTAVFGWGLLGVLLVAAFVFSRLPWRPGVVERDIFDGEILAGEVK